VDDQENVVPGSFFTIYDFVGYVAGSATSSDPRWTFSSSNLGINPPYRVHVDDPTVPNLTWTFNPQSPFDFISGPTSLGQFSVDSHFSGTRKGFFSGSGSYKPSRAAWRSSDWAAHPSPRPLLVHAGGH
jgi:hypothetical protein